MTMAAGPELDLGDMDRLDSRFKRRLATRIILVSLLSSVVAFLAADAGAREDENTREAERNAVAAMAEDAVTYVEYYGGLAGYAEAQPADLRRSVAEARAQLALDGYSGDAARWRAASGSLANLSPLLEPNADPAGAAQRSFQDLYYRVDLASLHQTTRRETADAWGARSERYSAVLAMLAIVLSVLGLAATFGQRLWRPLVRPAVAVALGCLVFTAAVAVPRVLKVPDDALEQVAEGNRRLRLNDVDGAIAAYSGAIDRAPRYATAYVRRAGAYALQGSSERDQSYVFSISDPEARARSIADLDRAFGLGADDDLLAMVTHGANYFFARRYDDAETLTRRATGRNPRLTVAQLNLGLALAAQGKAEEAATRFRLVTEQAAATADPEERKELFAAGHTTLEQLARQEPERAGLVRRLQDQLTAAQTTADAQRPLHQLAPGAAVSGLSVSVGDRSLTATYEYRGVGKDDFLGWILYTRPNPSAPWRQQPGLNRFELVPDAPGDGRAQTTLPEGRCPAAGDYRVDLYLEGVYQVSAQTTRPPSPERLTSDDDPLGSFSLCRPEEWKVRMQRPGMLDVGSRTTPQRLTVSVFPAPPELAREGAGRELAALADRLAARRGFRPVGAPPRPRDVGGMPGTLREYHRPLQIDRSLQVWVSLGPDTILRTVVLEGSFDDLELFDRLLARIAFARLDE